VLNIQNKITPSRKLYLELTNLFEDIHLIINPTIISASWKNFELYPFQPEKF